MILKRKYAIKFVIFMIALFNCNLVFAGKIMVPNSVEILKNEELLKVAGDVDKLLLHNDIYPDYYAGMFITDDKNNLIVQLVEKEIDEEYNQINIDLIKISNKIKIQYVENSFNDLLRTYNDINNYYKKFDGVISRSEFIFYTGHRIDVKNNVVVVNILPKNEKGVEKLSDFEKSFRSIVNNSKVLTFAYEDYGKDEVNLYVGEQIPVGCSLGYRAKISNSSGYITAAHCFNGLGDTFAHGTVTKYKNSGAVDAAFVKIGYGYTVLNNIYNYGLGIKQLSINSSPTLVVGSSIAHVGYSSGYEIGTILSLYETDVVNNQQFYNLLSTNYVSANGDSGGAVFIPSSGMTVQLVGIHKGLKTTNVKTVVKASSIMSEFNYSIF